MSRRYFPGATRAQLEGWLSDLNDEEVKDLALTSHSGPDFSATRSKGLVSVSARKRMVLHDLYVLTDEAQYGPDAQGARVTTVVFRDV